MKDDVAYRIRKLREQRDYSQDNMAGELKISNSAYSKIERGITDITIKRLKEIAGILKVEVTYFFTGNEELPTMQEAVAKYTTTDINNLLGDIQQMKKEIALLKKDLQQLKK